MKGILAAKKKPVESWTLADLGIDGTRGGPGRRLEQGVADDARVRPRRRAASSPMKTAPDRRLWSSSWPPASTSERARL